MGIEVLIGDEFSEPKYKPITVVAIVVPVSIGMYRSMHAGKLVRENVTPDMLQNRFGSVPPRAWGTVFDSSRRDERPSYSYNIWYSIGSGIGGGWNDPLTLKEDVDVFERFPSCRLLMSKVFYPRFKQMADAAGATVHLYEFDHPNLALG